MMANRPLLRWAGAFVLAALLVTSAGCGYHLAGTRGNMPAYLKTVAIPDFRNLSSRILVDQIISASVRNEFIKRMHLKLLTDSTTADALLEGELVDFIPTLVSYSSQSSNYTYSVVITLNFKFIDLTKNELLYATSNYKATIQFESMVADMYTWDNQLFIKALDDLGYAVTSAILDNF